MKIFVFFDAYASSYDIKDQIGVVGNMEGVTSSTLLQKAGGDEGAAYCVSVEADDAKAEELVRQVSTFASQYTGYVSNLKVLAYRPA